MKDILQDLISHTYDLGCVDLIKIEGTADTTSVSALADDKTLVIQAEFKQPVSEFVGVFGMPNMSTLKTLLGFDVYTDNNNITVTHQNKIPSALHFENDAKDFQNDYIFMIQTIVDTMLKTVKFKGATWHIEFEPTEFAIQRLKLQAQANPGETTFQSTVENGNLVFTLGDHSTHSGKMVFQHDVDGELKRLWLWPIHHVLNILSLHGDKTMRISDDGASVITVDSGLALYTYILPAHTK